MMLGPGSRLECVKRPPQGNFGEMLPVPGGVYSLRDVREFRFSGRVYIGVHLHEIRNVPQPYDGGVHEVYFGIEHFRPIEDRKHTGMEVLEKILRDPSGHKIKETA